MSWGTGHQAGEMQTHSRDQRWREGRQKQQAGSRRDQASHPRKENGIKVRVVV